MMLAALLAVLAVLYGIGLARLWRSTGVGKGIPAWQALAFVAGWLVLALALLSPLHELGESLLSAHMIEHELLMAVAAPLLVFSRPGPVLLWAAPRVPRRFVLGLRRHFLVASVWRRATDPVLATVLHGVAIWAWHVPVLFGAALEHEWLHLLQHGSFFGSGLLFWWAVLRRASGGAAIGHLFVTSMHMGLLGALMTLATRPLYPSDPVVAAAWGLSRLEDQQLAGLIMWLPAGLVYALAGVVLAGVWISGRDRAPVAASRPRDTEQAPPIARDFVRSHTQSRSGSRSFWYPSRGLARTRNSHS